MGQPSLPVPEEGLDEVLAAWSGRGQLLEALTAVDDEDGERRWSPTDIRRRAHRVLLASLLPALQTWPQRTDTWLDALPAEALRHIQVLPAPAAGVSWPATMRRHGWPPATFVVRARRRVADTLLVAVLRWTLETLREVRRDALAVEPSVDLAARQQLDVAIGLLEEEPLASATSHRPARHDLTAVRREGRPWAAVATVAQELMELDVSLALWARRMVAPDPELRWRLFHLAVFGVLLRRLRETGAACISCRPLSAAAPAPAYDVRYDDGTRWDLWFEAGGLWSYYARWSPYMAATTNLPGANQPLNGDIVLVDPDRGALIIECKFSASASTVGRGGVPQLMAYMVESRTSVAPTVHGYVVAPSGVPGARTTVDAHTGRLGVTDPDQLGDVLVDFLGHVAAGAASIEEHR